ncbi:MAG: hypothetical protein ACFB10_25630 [Salibacteraceae bacterium]
MSLKVSPAQFEAIAKEIHSETSPVGIDAKKTHILILQKLLDMEAQLADLKHELEHLKSKKS